MGLHWVLLERQTLLETSEEAAPGPAPHRRARPGRWVTCPARGAGCTGEPAHAAIEG